MSNIDKCIGANLTRLKAISGLSRDQIAEALGVEPDEVKLFEDGNKRISAAQIWVLSELLDEPVQSFFEGVT